MTIPDAAVRTNRSVTVLRHWARLGRIPAVKMGRDWFIRETDLALIEAMPRRNRKPRETPLPDLDPKVRDLLTRQDAAHAEAERAFEALSPGPASEEAWQVWEAAKARLQAITDELDKVSRALTRGIGPD